MPERFDVAVLGGGLAGLCLTRLLQLEAPELRVVTLDRARPGGRKVGEALVEIGALFLDRRLGLGPLLRRTQLPKNGLRFWFDDAAGELPLAEASEDGPMTFGYWQTFQLERERLEADLLRLNREGGADHRYEVSELETEPGHRVRFEHQGRRQELEARWLVDATGVASALGRQRGWLEPEPRVPHGACWAWFEGVRCPQAHLAEQGCRRQVIGHRLLSTNHLMGEGYWIWMIPLASGLMSVGLVYDPRVIATPPATAEQLVAFLQTRRQCRELMADARPVGFGRLASYAWRPRRWFGPDRTALIGLAGGFVDPFYSGGIDFVGLGCESVLALIRDDTEQRRDAYNALLDAFYEQNVLYVADLYRTFCSQRIRRPYYRRDIHLYWNLYAWPYFSGELLDPGFIGRWLPLAREGHRRSGFFAALARLAFDRLARAGTLREDNRGQYDFNQLGYRLFPYLNFERQMGHPYDLGRGRRLMDEADTGCLLGLMDALFDGDRSPLRRPLYRAVAENLERLLALDPRSPIFASSLFEILGGALGVTLDAERWGGLRGELADYTETPELERLDGLEPMGPTLQPGRTDWTFAHTPWALEPLDWQSVYEFMASRGQSASARHY